MRTVIMAATIRRIENICTSLISLTIGIEVVPILDENSSIKYSRQMIPFINTILHDLCKKNLN